MTENIWKNPDLAENFLQKSRYFLSIFAFINSTGKSIKDTERYIYSVIWKYFSLVFSIFVKINCNLAENILQKSHYISFIFVIIYSGDQISNRYRKTKIFSVIWKYFLQHFHFHIHWTSNSSCRIQQKSWYI